jgi:hypothetical protein
MIIPEEDSNAIIDNIESSTADRKRLIDFIYMENSNTEWRTKRKTYKKPATTINEMVTRFVAYAEKKKGILKAKAFTVADAAEIEDDDNGSDKSDNDEGL